MKHFTLILFALSFLVTPFVHAQATQYENQVIEKIAIELVNVPPTSSSDEAAVKARMKTKEGGIFSQSDFDTDLKHLVTDFDHVEPQMSSQNGMLTIKLKVWPKPVIRTIRWEGNERMSTQRLQDELGVACFSFFDRKGFNEAFHKVKAYYIRKGFFESELDYRVYPDPKSNEVDIVITVNEGRSGHISDIYFVNFTSSEMYDVLDQMMTKQYNIFTSWITGEGTYNEEAVRQDEFVILNYLQGEGYADAQVRIDVRESKKDKRIALYIIAEKGEKYRTGTITIEGNCLIDEATIRKLLLIKEGSAYSPELLRDSAKQIMDYYGRKGYIDTLVDYEPRLEYDEHTYSVRLVIEEGEQYRIGLIKVFGNSSTQTNVILHESLLIPGEVFNSNRLRLTEERLRNIGYFKNVNVYAVRSDGFCGLGDNFRDVHIEVEEMCTGSISASLGFSTVESAYGAINLTERNFNIRGFRDIFSRGLSALRGGGEYAHFVITLGVKSRSYVLSWMKPYIFDTPWSVGVSLEKSTTKYISKNYDIDSYGANFNAAYQINPFLRVGHHYRLRHSHVDLTKSDADKDLREAARRNGLVSAIGTSFVYDSTNHPACPTKGLKSTIQTEYAGIGGEVHFGSLSYLNYYYYPIDRRHQNLLKFRFDLTFIQPVHAADKLPLDERLFLGGDTVIRGYKDFVIGPDFSDNSPEGGISRSLCTAEYIYRMNEKIELFAFYDAGSLSLKTWQIGTIYHSLGYGARIYILGNAPLTFGMGYPINPRNKDDVKNFFLQVGGRF